MSRRIDPSWVVLESIENGEHDQCVDLFRRPDAKLGFEEFRRDVEDAGAGHRWPITRPDRSRRARPPSPPPRGPLRGYPSSGRL